MTRSFARLREFINSARNLPPEQQLLGGLLVVFFGAALIRAWNFYWFPGLPALYAKDLGVNFIIAEYIRHSVHSPADFIDALGWNTWWDQPAFFLNGYVSYAVIVPLADIVRNTWSAIKLLEILQSLAACLGTYWLLRLFGRPRIWALAAGAVFAAAPIIALVPRGNLDSGWPTTLAPCCLAIGILAIRKYGASALPAIGILCSLFGLCAALEYVLFFSVPLYVVLAAYAFDRSGTRRLAWAIAAVTGALAIATFGAYFMLPTLSSHLAADSTGRAYSLSTESFVPYFSQTLIMTLAFIHAEFLRSPNQAYNATPQLPYALVGGVVIWTFALIGVLQRRRDVLGSTFAVVTLLIVFALTFISMSAILPGGTGLWHLLGMVPVVRAIRTPDRYFTLPVVAIVIFGIEGIRTYCEALPEQKSLGVIFVGIAVVMFGFVDVSQQFWANQQDYGYEEPALQRVNLIVAARGPRMVSYALLHGGSKEDYPSYGVPTPTFSAAWDVAARYISDGAAGSGIMRRDATRTVIATPMWASSVPFGFPDIEEALIKSAHTRRIFRQSGVSVFALTDPDAAVVGTNISCISGPGLLDDILSVDAFRHVDFVEPGTSCSTKFSVNPDTRDALARDPGAVSGRSLCRTCSVLVDADDQFIPGPLVLNDPWFRHAVDGDVPIFGSSGAAILQDGSSVEIPPTVLRGGSTLALRIANSGYTLLDITADDRVATLSLTPFPGFRWFDVRLPGKQPRRLRLTVHIDPIAPSYSSSSWNGVALDGVVSDSASSRAIHFPRGIVLRTLDVASDLRSYDNAVYAINRLRYTHFGRTTRATFVWGAATGLATLAVTGTFSRGDEIRVATGEVSQSLRVTKPSTGKATAVFGIRATHGRRITIVDQMVAEPGAAFTIEALPHADRLRLGRRSEDLSTGDLDFAVPVTAFSEISALGVLPRLVSPGVGLDETKGASLTAIIPARAARRSLYAGLWQLAGDGSVRLSLTCGARRTSMVVDAATTSGLTIAPHGASCAVKLKWLGPLSIDRLFILADEKASIRASLPLRRGTYRMTFYDSSLRRAAGSLSIDGVAIPNGSWYTARTNAVHELVINWQQSPPSFLVAQPPEADFSKSTGNVTFSPVSATSYTVRVSERTDVKLAHLDDGNWMISASSKAQNGVRCDFVETCFSHVEPGTYSIYHRMPRATILGFIVTGVTVLCALLFLTLSPRRADG